MSIGNVMLLQDPEVQNHVVKYITCHHHFCMCSQECCANSLGNKVLKETDENKCSGMILDADHAVSLDQSKPSALSTHRTV